MARFGVTRASRLSNITLSANLGASAFHLAQLFAPGTGFYTLAANAAQPLFDGMTLLNKERSAVAALEQADAQYRSTGHQRVSECDRRAAFPAVGRKGG